MYEEKAYILRYVNQMLTKANTKYRIPQNPRSLCNYLNIQPKKSLQAIIPRWRSSSADQSSSHMPSWTKYKPSFHICYTRVANGIIRNKNKINSLAPLHHATPLLPDPCQKMSPTDDPRRHLSRHDGLSSLADVSGHVRQPKQGRCNTRKPVSRRRRHVIRGNQEAAAR